MATSVVARDLYVIFILVGIYMCRMYMLLGARWYLVGCNQHSIYVIIRFHVISGFSLVGPSFQIA